MATPGRVRRPTQLKMIARDESHRVLVPDSFRPITHIPDMPAHLVGAAAAEWDRLSTDLARYGMVSDVDRGVLAMICTTWGRYVEAEEMIERTAQGSGGTGLFVKSPNGFPIQSPWLAVSNKSIELYRSLLGEFGLSPAARARVLPGEFQLELPMNDDST